MAIQMFECNPLSMGGIKRMKLATRTPSDVPLTFPLDIVLKTNDESIIMLSDVESGRTITIGTDSIQYRIVYPYNASIIEEETNDRQGRFYNVTLNFELPQISNTTNNQLKNFLFTDSGEFAVSSMVAFIEDMNDNLWIAGYWQPLILESFDIQTGIEAEDNKYILSYVSKSYAKIKQYQLI